MVKVELIYYLVKGSREFRRDERRMIYCYNQEFHYYYNQLSDFTICIDADDFNEYTMQMAERIIEIAKQKLLDGIRYIIDSEFFAENYGRLSVDEFISYFKDYPLPNIWIKSNNIGVLEWIDDNYVISCLFEGMMENFNNIEVAS